MQTLQVQSAAAAILIVLSGVTDAAPRSHATRSEFQRQHPCPATGSPRGPCPGWIVDHVTPLCAGGPDEVTNMQWQTTEDAKDKDREERRQCSKQRAPIPGRR